MKMVTELGSVVEMCRERRAPGMPQTGAHLEVSLGISSQPTLDPSDKNRGSDHCQKGSPDKDPMK